MTESEASDALARAIASNMELLPRIPIEKFLPKILEVKTEAIKKSDVLELMAPASMSNVGGLDILKNWVSIRKHAFGHGAREAGVDKPKGALFVGPSGSAS